MAATGRPGAQAANIPGAWNFSDLHTVDPDASTALYTQVFGWKFDDIGFATMIRQPGYGDHLAATSDLESTAPIWGPGTARLADAFGWLATTPEAQPPHWHVTFTVADRDDSAEAAEQLGATVLSTTDSDWTRDAQIRDPQGAVFSISQYSPLSV